MSLAKTFFLVVTAATLLSACATISPQPQTKAARVAAPIAAMNTGPDVKAPHGFATMCARSPGLCQLAISDTAKPPIYTLMDPPKSLLDNVNRRVNANVRQQSDLATYKADDVWNRPIVADGLLSGDCEDLAIEKRQELIEAGVDPKSMFYAVVYRRDIGLHVLLVVSTSKGDLALDSRSPWIEPWNKVPYIWVKRQLAENPTQWAMVMQPGTRSAPIHLADASDTLTLANR